ncbi:MAG: mechanosensitive ion channel [Desulfobacteraceae bacterium]|jgi:small conductance mechanosensitive channel
MEKSDGWPSAIGFFELQNLRETKMDVNQMLGKVWELVTIYGLKVLAAVVIFVVGRWIAKLLAGVIRKMMKKSNVDETILKFVGNMAYIALMAFVVLAALSQLGIQTTSFIAVLGAAGLAIGLALQGSLSNFAAGFLMIIFRPIRVGDVIEGAGTAGKVEEIAIFTTTLVTPDNKTVIIPNSALTGDNIVNWTVKGTRRVDLVMGIGYEDDIDKAKQIMHDVLAEDDRILEEPAAQIAMVELADSSVNFVVRPWVNASDYWGVYMDTTEKIKKAFDAAGISIPYPQRDVHVYKHDVT